MKKQRRGYNPFRKVRHAANGLWFAVAHDFSVAYKVVVSGATLALAVAYADVVDVVVVLMATGLVLMAEIFNTAIETMCDYFETGHDERIGTIKDLGAAATGVCIVVWVVVIAWEIHRVLLATVWLGAATG